MIELKAMKIVERGNGYALAPVPSAFVKHGVVKIGQTFDVQLTQAKEEEINEG